MGEKKKETIDRTVTSHDPSVTSFFPETAKIAEENRHVRRGSRAELVTLAVGPLVQGTVRVVVGAPVVEGSWTGNFSRGTTESFSYRPFKTSPPKVVQDGRVVMFEKRR